MEVVSDTGRDGPPTVAEGVDLLDAFTAAATARHDAEVAVVDTLGRLVRAGVIESIEALPVDVHLAVTHHFTTAERAMLLDAADILQSMPATKALWRARTISWSQVRALVGQVRRYGREVRVALDHRIGASADVVELLDADRFEWTIAEAIADILGPEPTERDEQAASDESFVSIQLGLFGRSRIYGELDPIDTAIVVNGLDSRAAADDADATAGDDHRDGTDAGTAGTAASTRQTRRARRRTRAKRRAKALVGLLADSLAGRRRDGRTVAAKPLFVVHVPLDRITQTASGLLEVAAPGWLPTLSGRLTDALAADADLRAVMFDGARPLMVTRKLTAQQIPADTRLACAARDLGARDPGGRTP
ncbi:MAG TPA: hypothetical protein VMM13_06435, partial [Euzebya sp.]|nr:hypothetical protein [Euzebya sp.]